MRNIFLILSLLTTLACQHDPDQWAVNEKSQKVTFTQGDLYHSSLRMDDNKELKGSIAELEEAAQTSPKKHLLSLARLYLIHHDLEKAEKAIQSLLQYNSQNMPARLVMAHIHYRKSNFDLALIILNGLPSRLQDSSDVYNLRGLIALKNNKTYQASHYFQKGLEKNPQDIAIRMNLGVQKIEQRQFNQAAIHFERILNIIPSHMDAKMHLAVVYIATQKDQKAKTLLNEVMSHDPMNPIALFNLSILQARQHNYEDAIETMQKFVQSKRAKSMDNDRALALIERYQKASQQYDKVTDDEILEMAEDIKSAEPQKPIAKQQPIEELQQESEPSTQGSDSQESPSNQLDEDIELLERELQ